MSQEIQKKVQALLVKRLGAIQAKNPQYSLRAFSKSLNLSASVISEIINGKRNVSLKKLLEICDRFCLSPDEKRKIFQEEGAKSNGSNGPNGPNDQEQKPNILTLEIDQFKLISGWEHFAIISLAEIKTFQLQPQWIANQLNISQKKAKEAIVRLKRLGILRKAEAHPSTHPSEQRKWTFIQENLSTQNDIESSAIKKFHNESMEQAKQALFEQKIHKREFSSTTIALDSKRIPEIKKKVRKFMDQIMNDLDSDKNKNEVYKLNVQFFSITKEKK